MMLWNTIEKLSKDKILSLVENTTDFTISNGIVLFDKECLPKKRYKNIPITLFPSPIPKNEYYKIIRIQPSINKLMHLISMDFEFMCTALKNVAEHDSFIYRLLKIYKKNFERFSQNEVTTLGIFRTDYMFDSMKNEKGEIIEKAKQTETNTISSGMGSIGSKAINRMYQTILSTEYETSHFPESIPENFGNPGIGQGLAMAWQEYSNKEAVIVFFVMENESNISDQRTLEFNIYSINKSIKVRRKIYDRVLDKVKTDENGKLFVDGEEVAVAYFRTCYSPKHFPTEQHWKVREIIELSKAIKSPSVAHQLVGCKKIQQVISKNKVLEMYLENDVNSCNEIRSTFTGIYSLEIGLEGDLIVKEAIKNPEKFVLKPQREGGGNNLYDVEMYEKLMKVGMKEARCQYILMDLIKPNSYENYLIVEGNGSKKNVISELGIFGVCLTRGQKFLENYSSGHLHRVKTDQEREGGIMVGTGAVSSPFLY